jgi:hypothetical protein
MYQNIGEKVKTETKKEKDKINGAKSSGGVKGKGSYRLDHQLETDDEGKQRGI